MWVPVADIAHHVQGHGVAGEGDEAVRPGVKEHLPLRRGAGQDVDHRGHAPDVVMEHGNRLEEAIVAVVVLAVLPADTGQVLRMDAKVRVQVGDDHLPRVKAFLGDVVVEDGAAPGHCRRLAYDDARQHRVEDVPEPEESSAELVPQTPDIFDAVLVAGARDDGDHLSLRRVLGGGQRRNSRLQHFVALGVGRDENGVIEIARVIGDAILVRPGGRLQVETTLPPVDPSLLSDAAEGRSDAAHHDDRSNQPVHIQQDDEGHDEYRVQ